MQNASHWVALVLVLTAAGCSGLQSVDSDLAEASRLPQAWVSGESQDHLSALRGREAAGRGTATPGLAFAAAYASERMREFGLQPILANSYRHLYLAPIHHVADLRIQSFGRDTLLVPVSALSIPDGRSDVGRVEAEGVWRIRGEPLGRAPARVGVVAADQAADADLAAWRDAGLEAVLLVGTPRARRAETAVEGLLIARLAPQAAAVVLRVPAQDVLSGPASILPVRLRIEVAGASDTGASGVNVAGYVPGRDPFLRNELVVLSAPLDGPGAPGGIWVPSSDEGAVGAAALLLLARAFSAAALRQEGPDRSMLFLLYSGGEQAASGWKAVARRPPWPADAVAGSYQLTRTCEPAAGKWVQPLCLTPPSVDANPALADSVEAFARRVFQEAAYTAGVRSSAYPGPAGPTSDTP